MDIGPVAVVDEVSQCAMEAANGIKVMPTAIPDPPKTGGVEAMRTIKGNPPRNAGTMAREARRGASAGKSAPIRREPVLEMPTKEIGSDRTMPNDLEKPEKGQSS